MFVIYVGCIDCVEVCGNVCCVTAIVKDTEFLSLRILKYVVCLCEGCDGCSVFCLYCEECRYADVVGLGLVCIVWHFSMLAVCECWLRMQEATIWKRHTPELITALYVAMSVSFCLPYPVAVSVFIICRGCVRVQRCCECVCCMLVLGVM